MSLSRSDHHTREGVPSVASVWNKGAFRSVDGDVTECRSSGGRRRRRAGYRLAELDAVLAGGSSQSKYVCVISPCEVSAPVLCGWRAVH